MSDLEIQLESMRRKHRETNTFDVYCSFSSRRAHKRVIKSALSYEDAVTLEKRLSARYWLRHPHVTAWSARLYFYQLHRQAPTDLLAGSEERRGKSRLVLSLFPGAGLLDRGFEQAGFVVVRGPDTLFGQDIRNFHFPCSAVEGVVGGPPCQDFSGLRRRPPTGYGLKMIAEFRRVVTEAQPDWWLMENVPRVPDVHIAGYVTQRFNVFASEFGLAQKRNRSFQFGSRDGLKLVLQRGIESQKLKPAVLAKDSVKRRRNFADLCELQGLPRDFALPGRSLRAKVQLVGNGVPVPVAQAIATAILNRSSSVTGRLCACDCGRLVTGRAVLATAACRKRMERRRRRSMSHASRAAREGVSATAASQSEFAVLPFLEPQPEKEAV